MAYVDNRAKPVPHAGDLTPWHGVSAKMSFVVACAQ
jgi:hypothetical protein